MHCCLPRCLEKWLVIQKTFFFFGYFIPGKKAKPIWFQLQITFQIRLLLTFNSTLLVQITISQLDIWFTFLLTTLILSPTTLPSLCSSYTGLFGIPRNQSSSLLPQVFVFVIAVVSKAFKSSSFRSLSKISTRQRALPSLMILPKLDTPIPVTLTLNVAIHFFSHLSLLETILAYLHISFLSSSSLTAGLE